MPASAISHLAGSIQNPGTSGIRTVEHSTLQDVSLVQGNDTGLYKPNKQCYLCGYLQ